MSTRESKMLLIERNEQLKREWREMFENRKMDLQTIRILKSLVTELADALEGHDWREGLTDLLKNEKLIQRAREATK